MKENELPEFGSLEELVEFFDTQDMGEYDLPEVHFDGKSNSPRTAALPLDVRKASGLPATAKNFSGLCPDRWGRSPEKK